MVGTSPTERARVRRETVVVGCSGPGARRLPARTLPGWPTAWLEPAVPDASEVSMFRTILIAFDASPEAFTEQIVAMVAHVLSHAHCAVTVVNCVL